MNILGSSIARNSCTTNFYHNMKALSKIVGSNLHPEFKK